MHVCVGWCVKWNSLWCYTTLPSYNFIEWMISMIVTVRLWRHSNIVRIRPDLFIWLMKEITMNKACFIQTYTTNNRINRKYLLGFCEFPKSHVFIKFKNACGNVTFDRVDIFAEGFHFFVDRHLGSFNQHQLFLWQLISWSEDLKLSRKLDEKTLLDFRTTKKSEN